MNSVRAGFSAVELLVALLISVLVLSMTATVFTTQFRVALRTLRSLEGDRTAGLAWSILSAELRGTGGPRDYRVGPGDSVRTRAFRGSAWPCPGDPGHLLRVTYRGDRAPNVAKDSVLALTDQGRWVAFGLSRVGSIETCPSTGGSVRRWTVSGASPSLTYLRLFESGTYSVERGALRYRAGRGGRQPVTAERFDTAAALQRAGPSLGVGVAATLPIAQDEYGPATNGGRRAAWPRRGGP